MPRVCLILEAVRFAYRVTQNGPRCREPFGVRQNRLPVAFMAEIGNLYFVLKKEVVTEQGE
jgi:hypothetical protein